ncbi:MULTISPECIES: GNAT family N-acetyltransferase [Ralstonia]|jgi:predicted N-acetyltransferase YhbS|uniref:N-acetyltransferase domain-containing protein n=2 Tax=Ralstonia TaxID=48736 RepID=A0AAD2EYJ3_9RALS|nr:MULTISPECIES: GNAT family N-acetyltransferase [Ralstonia]MEA3269796.1 GNAT family N-acetyltransferase [Pseudomonadota bacterium]NBF18176.1 GNAT family N-acetyltransferase [Pseudomonas sp. Fl4BN2]ENZ75483.1 putative acetyltransferase [Ralstonia pickettii OR214]MBB0026308.1 N-acetyltransferase [Ralstonia pickettii]MBB0037174.1 N-acetyltransferase [Ralstonia pickettii]
MSELTIRPIAANDLPGILAVQQACYGDGFLEPGDALASRWARSPAMCLVAVRCGEVVGYLLSHAWHAWTPPKLHVPLPIADAANVLWFVHDMAIAPAGRGQRLGEQLYAMASASAHAQGLRQSRLVAVQGADVFWRRLGYQPADVDGAALAALRAVYGEDAELMERALP